MAAGIAPRGRKPYRYCPSWDQLQLHLTLFNFPQLRLKSGIPGSNCQRKTVWAIRLDVCQIFWRNFQERALPWNSERTELDSPNQKSGFISPVSVKSGRGPATGANFQKLQPAYKYLCQRYSKCMRGRGQLMVCEAGSPARNSTTRPLETLH